MSRSRWVAAVGGAVGAGALIVGCVIGAAAWSIGPYVLDDRTLDGAVNVVAITWSDAGLDAAEEQLRFELDAGGIGPHVDASDCQFEESAHGLHVRCAWSVEVVLAPSSAVVPLSFVSQATIDATGHLR